MNRITERADIARWWLETTTEWGKQGIPRPFKLYVEEQLDLAIMESIRKPPSRQTKLNLLEDPDCMGTAEYFAILLDREDLIECASRTFTSRQALAYPSACPTEVCV